MTRELVRLRKTDLCDWYPEPPPRKDPKSIDNFVLLDDQNGDYSLLVHMIAGRAWTHAGRWSGRRRADFEVGYESASQFNREYSHFFGQPPMRDIRILRPQAICPWSRSAIRRAPTARVANHREHRMASLRQRLTAQQDSIYAAVSEHMTGKPKVAERCRPKAIHSPDFSFSQIPFASMPENSSAPQRRCRRDRCNMGVWKD
jgi:hypothetical protein